MSKNSVTKCQNIQLEIVKKFSCTSVHLVQLYVQHVYVISAQKKIICVHHVYVPSAQKNMMMCNMCMWWQDVSSVYVPSAQKNCVCAKCTKELCMCQCVLWGNVGLGFHGCMWFAGMLINFRPGNIWHSRHDHF